MTTPFTVGLVQMRSGLDPARNLDAAVKLIEEAKANGADYVQTPEMTNIVANKRDIMLAATAPEEERHEPRRVPRRWRASSASICTSARSRSGFRRSAPPTARS